MLPVLYEVTSFRIIEPCRLLIEFDDGSSQEIDFEPVLYGRLNGPLRDLKVFEQVQLDAEAGTLIWPNGADFDPETLRNWPRCRDAWIKTAQRLAQQATTSTA